MTRDPAVAAIVAELAASARRALAIEARALNPAFPAGASWVAPATCPEPASSPAPGLSSGCRAP